MKRIVFTALLAGILFHISLTQDSKENADFKLAVNLYNDKMYDLALEQFHTFINLYPSSQQCIDARFYLGLTQEKLAKYDDARLTFQDFALAYPDNARAAEAWMNVAAEYVAVHNIREAALAYERVKTFHPRSKFAAPALLQASCYYEQLNDRDNLRRVLQILTQEYSSPEVLPARIKLAQLFIDDNQPEQAQQECKQVIDNTKDPELIAQALFVQSKALNALGRNQESENALNKIIAGYKNTTKYFEAELAYADLKNREGNTDGAMDLWRTVADEKNAPVQLRQNAFLAMAEANMRIRNYTRALDLFGYAGGFRGVRNGEAYYRAGVAAECLNNPSAAAASYTRALTDSAGATDRRAVIIGAFKGAVIVQNYTEALRLVRLYLQEFSVDGNLARLLVEGAALATEKLHDTKAAEDFCEYIIAHFPQSKYIDDALFQLGAARHAAGEYTGALVVFDDLQRRYPSSEFIPEAQKQQWLINEFELRQSETNLQKLALLVGDVIAQKSKGKLAFRLAEIYFHDMKDYQLAADQYRFALSQDLDESTRPAAWYGQAQSFEHLALRSGLNTEAGKSAIQKAISCYDSLIVHFPAGEFSDKAIIAAFSYRLQLAEKPEEVRSLGSEFFAKSQSVRGKELALLALGNSYLALKKYDDAALTYKLLLEKYAGSESAATAQFQMGVALNGMMMKDSAASVLAQFVARYPNHMKAAAAAAMLAQWFAEHGNIPKTDEYCTLLSQRYFYCPVNGTIDRLSGTAYFYANDFPQAAQRYASALNAFRTDYFAVAGNPEIESGLIYNLGYCCEKTGDTQGVKKWFGEYITRDQSSEQAGHAYQALAAAAKNDNDVKLATLYLTEADRINTKLGRQTSSLALETAELLFSSEKYSEAAENYVKAAAKTKSDSVLQYLQARTAICYFRLDNYDEANKLSSQFVKNHPDAVEYAAQFEFERGKYFLRKDKTEEAKARFANVLHIYARTSIVPEALFWQAHIDELNQQTQLAVVIYDSLLQYFPQNEIIPRVHLSLGNAYYAMEQWDAASKQYRAILDNEKKSPDLIPYAMSNLIMTYKEMELFDGALELTRKYIDRFPNDTDLIDKKIDIGILYQKLGYYDQAVLQLQSLIEGASPDLEAELRYYIGESYFYKGDFQQSILEFLKVPYLVTQHGKMDWISTSYYMAGQAYEKMSKYDQAMTMYKQILDRKDTDVQFKTAAAKEIERVKQIVGIK